MRLATFALSVLLLAPLAAAQPPKPPPPRPAPPAPTATMPTADATMKDITQTLGFMPQWMRVIPPAMLPGAWQTMKALELSDQTKLDGKTKELIGVAVAAQIPCEYCVMFHTEAARKNGATDQEIQEAIGMSASTRMFSTIVNGNMVDKTQFKADLDKLMARPKQQAAR